MRFTIYDLGFTISEWSAGGSPAYYEVIINNPQAGRLRSE
jgi:hypothetical protein